MLRKFALLLVASVLLVSGVAAAGQSPWATVTQTTVCQDVSTTAVTLLAADSSRIRWSIWTTSGAATIYFRENGTAITGSGPGGNNSGMLTAGQSYTEDYAAVTTAVTAITKSGTAHVCAKSAVQ